MSYEQHVHDAAAGEAAYCAVVTLSDTRSPENDTSGQRIRELLGAAGHIVSDYRLLKDDPDALEAVLSELLARGDVEVILTNGGTGVSRRDATVPVIECHLDTPLPGFGEL